MYLCYHMVHRHGFVLAFAARNCGCNWRQLLCVWVRQWQPTMSGLSCRHVNDHATVVCFWSLEDLYELMDLEQYGYASAWVSNSFATWDKRTYDVFGIPPESCVVLDINHCRNERAFKKNSLPWLKRCPPPLQHPNRLRSRT